MAKQLTDDEIRAIIAREVRLANGSDRSSLSKSRQTALEYFEGKMEDVPAESGRSSVVSRDVNDTVGWILPGLMDVFGATEDTALVEPTGPEDVQFAEDATLLLNHVFWKKNDGYKVLYEGTHDALLLRDAIVKVWHEEKDKSEVTTHSGLDDMALAALLDGEDVEVLAHTLNDDGTHDVKLKREGYEHCYMVDVIPPEDFFIDPDAASIEEARFLAHRTEKTRSQLLEMGFDSDKVKSLQVASRLEEPEQVSRGEDHMDGESTAADEATELVNLYECQFQVDVDGDGEAETIRAYYGGKTEGGTLLDWEVWDDEPMFYSIPCKKVPHRFDSQSIADDTIEPQKVKTVLQRQALDNIYATNLPQKEVESGSVLNMDELTSPSFGGVILKKAGSAPIVPHVTPFVANYAFEAIGYQDEVIARRTGVSQQSMALDADALQNQSATANNNAKDAGYSKVKLIARNMAEFGWKKVFRALLRLIIKHQDKPMMIRLANKEWKPVDPKPWNMDMDVTIDIGLGTGSRERDMMLMQNILGNQMAAAERLAAAGMTDKAMEFIPYILNTMKKIVRASGLKAPDQYFPDITEEDIAAALQKMAQSAGQPSPDIMAKMQLEEAKMAAARDKEMAQMEADVRVKEAELAKARALEEQRMQFEFTVKQEDLAFQREKLAQERELELLKMGMKDVPEMGPATMEDERNNAVMQGLERLAMALEGFSMSQARPKTVVGPNGKTYTVQVN